MRSERIELTCTHCAKTFSARIITQVDFARPEDCDANFSDGSLFTYTCPHCQKKVYYNHYLLWVDEPHSIAVCNLTCEEEKNAMEEALSALSAFGKESSMQRRYVASPLQLYEKIMIFSSGLDDRIVEIVKQFLAARVLEEHPQKTVSDVLFCSSSEEEYLFAFRCTDGDLTVNIPKHAFETVAAQFSLNEPSPSVVDAKWAVKYLTKEKR